jgi:hypothetical protein
MFDLSSKLIPTLGTAVLGVTAIVISPAQAIPVTYDFTVNVNKGSLAGQSYSGTFSYDDAKVKGTDIEEVGVKQGLTVSMNYFGRTYRETDDSSYPTFPKLIFENGKLKQLDFWVQPQKRVVWWNAPGWQVKTSLRETTSIVPCQKR